MSNRNFTPRIKNALDNYKLRLNAPCPGQSGKWSNLSWYISNNEVKLNVYTNDPNTKDPLTVKLSPTQFWGICALLDKAVVAENDWSDYINIKDTIWNGRQPSKEKGVVGTVKVGKDREGVVWMCLLKGKSDARVKFKLLPGDDCEYFHGDGTPYLPAELSQMFAKNYADLMRELSTHVLATTYVEPKKKDFGGNNNNGGNRGGNGGNNNNQGGGYNDSDDDIPF